MKKFIAAIGLIATQLYFGQDEDFLPKIVPPSPQALELGKYGNVPVGLFTGSANISVPLLAYKTNNIIVPIELFYGSNGIKVDDISTNVGLGWNLNFGGIITRTVRDRADETSTHIDIPDNITGGYTSAITNQVLHTIAYGATTLDTEADLYSFNFNGNSGKFFYDFNNQPHIVDQQAIKIERIGTTTGDGQDFLLTLSNGEKYYFEAKERSTFRNSGSGDGSVNPLNSSITAWYLTKIVHPNGEEIYFSYANTHISYVNSQAQILKMSVGYPGLQQSCPPNIGYLMPPTLGIITDNNVDFEGKRIQTITSNNSDFGTISFFYETDNTTQDIDGNIKITNIRHTDRDGNIIENITLNYLNTSNKRNFLSTLIFKDPSKNYSFEYENPSQFPVRLSFSQDRWGYYNGKSNSNLIPANVSEYNLRNFNYNGANKEPDPNFAKIGMLKRIKYPTKGFTDLEYEGNTYWGEKTIYPTLFSKTETAKTDNFTDANPTVYIINSPTDQEVTIKAYLNGNSISACSSFVNNGHYTGSLEVISMDPNQTIPTQFYINGGNGGINYVGSSYSLIKNQENTLGFHAEAGKSYKVTLSPDFMCSNVRAIFSYYNAAPQVINANLDTGGVRIKSAKDFDTSASQSIYKRYYYAHKDDLNHSSGQQGNNPFYTDISKRQIQCSTTGPLECTFVENSDIILTSSSLIPLYNTETNACLYNFVTISEGGDQFERGGVMKEFKIRRNNAGSIVWGPIGKSNTPWNNRGWDNGVELKSTLLIKKGSSSLEIIQEKENIYERNDTRLFEMKNFAGRQLFNIACPTAYVSHPYTCLAADISTANNKCTGLSVGTQVYLKELDNISVTDYRLISYWHYLKSQKTTDYLDGAPVQTHTEYFYDNPSNYQLSRQKTISPDGTINEVSYQYAHEKGNQLMIGKNMVGIPLQTTTTQTTGSNTKTLSKTETIYPASVPTVQTGNLVLPLEIKSYDTLNNIPSTEVKYDKYDEKGNILQYTTKDGLPVAIVWGYNKTQPIAKVEGITYDQLTAAVSISAIVSASDQDASNPATEDQLLSVLNDFRKQTALADKQVTTFTYDPLIGVTSITPPTGIREIYSYDTANRLKEVKVREKDNTGNYVYRKVKEFNYNYKQ